MRAVWASLLVVVCAGRAADVVEWRLPYQGLTGARVQTEWVTTPAGKVLHRRVTLPAGERLKAGQPPQAELVPRDRLELYHVPKGFEGPPLLYGTLAGRWTFLYLQHLGQLGPLLDAAARLPAPVLAAGDADLGWRGPALGTGFAAREDLVLSDAWLLPAEQVPADADGRAALFLKLYGALLAQVQPASQAVEEPWAIAEPSLRWLEQRAPGITVAGHRYVYPYATAPWRDHEGELLVQLLILEPLLRWQRATGHSSALAQELLAGLPAFYDPGLHTLLDRVPVNPAVRHDSWYYLLSLALLADVAADGHPEVAPLLRNSLEYARAFAHEVDYHFPIFYYWSDRKNRTGAEDDAVYAYLYVMVRAAELFGDEPWLAEARQAAERTGLNEFKGPYELHLEAVGCAALARLARKTGDARYLTLSRRPFAYLMAHVCPYQADWGFRDGRPTFLAVSAIPGVYTAPTELWVSARYLADWLELGGRDLPDDVRELATRYLRFAGGVTRWCYPDRLAPGALIARGPVLDFANDRGLPIPVEDYRWDNLPCGQLSHETYGAGAAFSFAVLQAKYPALRSVGSQGTIYAWPRGLAVSPGEAGVLPLYGVQGPVQLALDGPPGLTARLVTAATGPAVELRLPDGSAPGSREALLWLGNGGHWRPQRLQLRVREPVREWRPALLTPAACSRSTSATVAAVDGGLRVGVPTGAPGANAVFSDVRLPADARRLRVRVAAVDGPGQWMVKLSGDWNGDGVWPGHPDDWVPIVRHEPGEVLVELPLYLRERLAEPLVHLQLGVSGPGTSAVFASLAFEP